MLQAGQGLFISPTGVLPITTQPDVDGPRPDGVTVPAKLFAREDVPDAREGLFVFVRDGHIEVATAGEVLHLGRGEAGFAGRRRRHRAAVQHPEVHRLRPPAAAHRQEPVAADACWRTTTSRPANTCK